MAIKRQRGDGKRALVGGEEPTVIVDSVAASSDGAPSAAAVRAAASLLKDPAAPHDDEAAKARVGERGDEHPESEGVRAERPAQAAQTAGGVDAGEEQAGEPGKKLSGAASGLIDDHARPFFLAGCALLFALLGFFDGDDATGPIFVLGSILFVLGAAFSSELGRAFTKRPGAERGGDQEA